VRDDGQNEEGSPHNQSGTQDGATRFPLRPTQSWPASSCRRRGPTTASIGTVGSDALHGLIELVDLVAEMIARLRIDNGDGGRDGKTCGVPDRTRSAGRDLHDPGAEADPPISQNLPLRESAADESSTTLGSSAYLP
jgi:hypothetical protein